MADFQTRHGRGLMIVVLLAVIFFTLIGLIILKSGGDEPRPIAESETLTVLPIRIRIRTEPQARAPVVATATSGEQVVMLEDRGAWVRVRTGEGLSGWAERANLERTIEQQRRAKRVESIRRLPPLKGEATQNAQLYAGPGIFYPLIGEVKKGTDVTVYTRDHEFYAIARGNSIAYADADSIDITAPTAHRLDVQPTGHEPSLEERDTEPPPAVADTAFSERPAFDREPEREPEPPPAPAAVERSAGVYSVVPPGGTQPVEIDREIPRYPQTARRAGIEGPVVVRGIVRKNGRIDNVEVIRDLPYGLGESARRAVSRWRFRPATYRGEPIDVYYTVTVNFKLR